MTHRPEDPAETARWEADKHTVRSTVDVALQLTTLDKLAAPVKAGAGATWELSARLDRAITIARVALRQLDTLRHDNASLAGQLITAADHATNAARERDTLIRQRDQAQSSARATQHLLHGIRTDRDGMLDVLAAATAHVMDADNPDPFIVDAITRHHAALHTPRSGPAATAAG